MSQTLRITVPIIGSTSLTMDVAIHPSGGPITGSPFAMTANGLAGQYVTPPFPNVSALLYCVLNLSGTPIGIGWARTTSASGEYLVYDSPPPEVPPPPPVVPPTIPPPVVTPGSMNPMYTSADQVFNSVASVLGVTPSHLEAKSPKRWGPITTAAATSASAHIHALLTGTKGYSPAQVAADPRVPTLALDLGTYWALLKGAMTKDYDTTAIELFGQAVLTQLKQFPVMTSAGPSEPNDSTITAGRMDAVDGYDASWLGRR